MLIDWFTVTAQIINFLILIYLLKRFLYKPILKAMDERERKIAARLQEAAEKREKAETDAEFLAGQRRELEQNREKILAEAREEIKQWREEAKDKARGEVEKMRQTWQENIAREKEDFTDRLKSSLGKQVFRVAAKAVQDLADESFEAGLVKKFIGMLPEAVAEIGEMDRGMGNRLQVKTGFELKVAQEDEIKAALADLFPETEVVFKVEPEVGYGVRLVGNNRKIEWSLDRYMGEMEEKILGTLQSAWSPKR